MLGEMSGLPGPRAGRPGVTDSESITHHIGALGALLDGLAEEAGRLAVVLLDEAAVREHRREVIGEDAPRER